MKKTDLLSLDVNIQYVYVLSTDPQEVKYFGQLLVQKFGENKLFGPTIKNGTYVAVYKFAAPDSTDSGILQNKDVEWWLFNVAIQRGWSPFSSVGSFTRVTDILDSQ